MRSWVFGMMFLGACTAAYAGFPDPYIGVELGAVRSSLATPQGDASPQTARAAGVTLGTRLSPTWAIEADVMGRVERRPAYQLPPALSGATKASAMAVRSVPLSGDLSLLLKAGLGWVHSEARYLLPYVKCAPDRPDCAQAVARQDRWGPAVGTALQWDHRPWSVRIQYDWLPSGHDAMTVGVGVLRHFH